MISPFTPPLYPHDKHFRKGDGTTLNVRSLHHFALMSGPPRRCLEVGRLVSRCLSFQKTTRPAELMSSTPPLYPYGPSKFQPSLQRLLNFSISNPRPPPPFSLSTLFKWPSRFLLHFLARPLTCPSKRFFLGEQTNPPFFDPPTGEYKSYRSRKC